MRLEAKMNEMFNERYTDSKFRITDRELYLRVTKACMCFFHVTYLFIFSKAVPSALLM